MAQVDSTTFTNLLKTLFPQEKVHNLAMLGKEWLGRVPKKQNFYGKNMVVPVDYGNPQGRSASLTKAKTNATAASNIAWTVTRAKDYGYIEYDAETLAASSNDDGAFAEAVQHDGNMLIDELSKSLAIALYGSGSGSIGQIATGGIAGSTITLTNKYDVLKFAKNMVLALSAADGGGALKSGGATMTVASKSFAAGTVTMTAGVVASIAAAAAGDFVFADGDYDAKVKGLEGWLPQSVTATAWFGVDRTVDPEALGGWRVTDTTLPPEEAFLQATELVVMGGGKPNLAITSPPIYANLIKGLSSKVVYQGNGQGMTVGTDSVTIMIDGAKMELVADPLCPATRTWILQKETWTFHHLLALPHIVADDGQEKLRLSSGSNLDAIEMRCRYYGQLVCRAPGRNAVVTHAVPA